MGLRIIMFLDPVVERAVERFERGQVKFAREELLPDRAKISLHFSFGVVPELHRIQTLKQDASLP